MAELFFSVVIINYSNAQINQIIDRAKRIKNSEVVVIESGKPVLDARHKSNIKYKFFNERLMPGAARNEGAKIAKGKYILFLDSDVVLTEQSLDYLNRSREHFGKDIIFGCYERNDGPTTFSKFQNNLLYYRFVDVFNKQHLAFGQSSHMIIRRDIFIFIGGFNALLRMKEDTEFCFRASELGIKNRVNAELTGRHLKQFSYGSLHVDYFLKTMHSIKVKVEQPKIFNMGSTLLPKSMLGTFVISFMGLLLMSIFGFMHVATGITSDLNINGFLSLIFVG